MSIHSILKTEPQLLDQFTKKEEYSSQQTDMHGRFVYSSSCHKNVKEPEVSRFLVENGLDIEWPDGKKFAVCLTHDVDDIYPPFSHRLACSACCLKELDIKGLQKPLINGSKRDGNSPYINFKKIMEIEDRYDAKSSFYFIAAQNDPKRFRYDVEDIETEIANIVDSGWEVGLHGGYYSYDSPDEILKEKSRLENVLGKNVIGYRNHYLRFKVPDSWEMLANAGFKYDTTFGYSDMIGFRNGMCHPFKPYDLDKGKEIDILEIPLNIMEVTLISISSSCQEAWEHTKKLIDTVERYNGVITLLWHNNSFNWKMRDDWQILYEKILRYCYSKNAWLTSGEQIWEWWTNGYRGNR